MKYNISTTENDGSEEIMIISNFATHIYFFSWGKERTISPLSLEGTLASTLMRLSEFGIGIYIPDTQLLF